jgi:3,4-dihydroxy 2-butanone 4-phosphate synthase/GTP cyclohydrolase II
MCAMPFCTIEDAVADIRAGRMVILVDDESRENEGDLCFAAEKTTPELINFMARFARGLICLSLTSERCEKLRLPLQTEQNTTQFGTAFTVTVDAREGVTTGISAADRARTILTAVGEGCRPEDLARPGHTFPLRARDGGVLVRAGQTEGSVDLARLAGLNPAGVICEIMNDDGTMARLPELEAFGREHGIRICSVADLIAYRRRTEKLVERTSVVSLPTAHGSFDLHVYAAKFDHNPHLALCKGPIGRRDDFGRGLPIDEPVLVRVHSECLTGDVFGSCRCDCGPQLREALRLVEREGRGVVLYMRQEGRGIGLANKMRAYELMDRERIDTVEANRRLGFPPDLRDYGVGAQILWDLGIRKMRMVTNNPRKIVALEGYGLEIVERVPLEIASNEQNRGYLAAKKEKLGHLLSGL